MARSIQKEIKRSKIETEENKLRKILENKWNGIHKIKNKPNFNPQKLKKAEQGFIIDYQEFKKKYGNIPKFEQS